MLIEWWFIQFSQPGPTANGHAIHHPSARVASSIGCEASVDEVVHFGVERDGYVSANNSTELKGVLGLRTQSILGSKHRKKPVSSSLG